MSSRSIRGRLDKLGAPPATAGPVCRFHGEHCQMGARWPTERPPAPDDLLDLVINGRKAAGLPYEQHPRDRWATDRHEQVPDAELRQEEREMAELLADLKAKNARTEAELLADREAGRP